LKNKKLIIFYQDENSRIESLGGSVIFWGTWRVNGQLAVSRAIGKRVISNLSL